MHKAQNRCIGSELVLKIVKLLTSEEVRVKSDLYERRRVRVRTRFQNWYATLSKSQNQICPKRSDISALEDIFLGTMSVRGISALEKEPFGPDWEIKANTRLGVHTTRNP